MAQVDGTARETGFDLTRRDRKRLEGVHPDLVRIVEQAAHFSPRRFMVIEGLRTIERQRELVAAGKSRTMNSRHLTGHAVDLAPLADDGHSIPWSRWDLFHELAAVVKRAAEYRKVPIEWGGDWESFKDGPHFQLPHAKFPA